MKINYFIIAILFCLSYPTMAQNSELDALGYLSTENLNDSKINDYDIFLLRLKKNKNLNTEERLLYNYYSSIRPFLEINSSGKAPIAENKIRDYVNHTTISALAKGCTELLDYEKKSGSQNKTDAITKFILHSNSLLQYTAISYVKENMYAEALTVIRAINMLLSKTSVPHPFTDAEMFFYYAAAQVENKERELAEKCFYQAIEINPHFFDAYYELARLKIAIEIDYYGQMTQLDKVAFTKENQDAYEVLETALLKNRNAVVPILEKALVLKPDDNYIKTSLLSFYEALQMTDKYTALKNKI